MSISRGILCFSRSQWVYSGSAALRMGVNGEEPNFEAEDLPGPSNRFICYLEVLDDGVHQNW